MTINTFTSGQTHVLIYTYVNLLPCVFGSHAQKYIPGVYLHVCKLYTRVNLAHANWTLVALHEISETC